MFQVTKTDLAARIGTIQTNHGKVETPAFVPVIHPVRQTIPSRQIRAMGFDLVITNAYITRNSYGERAVTEGIHGIIGHDGAVMTDSGGYQVLEYGDVPVLPKEMAEYERDIMTDFAIPLDKPTGFGLPLATAKSYVKKTLDACRQTMKDSEENGQIWMGPIQGGEHSELVARSTKALVKMGYGMLALGSPVEFMESYEYGLLAEMIIMAKRNIPHDIPLHLFGAGHPLTIPLAVALGCDTFDSASYMLYARQGRYITADGTRRITEITEFPCSCAVCSSHTPAELRDNQDGTNLLAIHNLYAIKLEVDKTRQAIHEGRLWEHVIKKARAHPKLYDIIRVMSQNSGFLSVGTPRFKEKAVFLFGPEDQYRPEAQLYHGMVRRFHTKKTKLILVPESGSKPAYLSRRYAQLGRKKDFDKYQVCEYSPHLGLVPVELSDLFPAAHSVAARTGAGPQEFAEFAKTWGAFFANNSFAEVYYDKKDAFLAHHARSLPRTIKRRQLTLGSEK